MCKASQKIAILLVLLASCTSESLDKREEVDNKESYEVQETKFVSTFGKVLGPEVSLIPPTPDNDDTSSRGRQLSSGFGGGNRGSGGGYSGGNNFGGFVGGGGGSTGGFSSGNTGGGFGGGNVGGGFGGGNVGGGGGNAVDGNVGGGGGGGGFGGGSGFGGSGVTGFSFGSSDMSPIPGIAGQDYPNLAFVPRTGFSCGSQLPGYYADTSPESGCQVFHICQFDGRLDSFLCPNGTIFNQQYFVCDWWFNFECGSAQQFYRLNAEIGKVNGNFGGGNSIDGGNFNQGK